MSSQEHRGDVVGVLDSRQVGEEFEYLVRWTGGEETWVERSILEDDAPRVLDTFRRHNPSHHFRSVDLEDGYQEWIRGVQWRHEHKMPKPRPITSLPEPLIKLPDGIPYTGPLPLDLPSLHSLQSSLRTKIRRARMTSDPNLAQFVGHLDAVSAQLWDSTNTVRDRVLQFEYRLAGSLNPDRPGSGWKECYPHGAVMFEGLVEEIQKRLGTEGMISSKEWGGAEHAATAAVFCRVGADLMFGLPWEESALLAQLTLTDGTEQTLCGTQVIHVFMRDGYERFRRISEEMDLDFGVLGSSTLPAHRGPIPLWTKDEHRRMYNDRRSKYEDEKKSREARSNARYLLPGVHWRTMLESVMSELQADVEEIMQDPLTRGLIVAATDYLSGIGDEQTGLLDRDVETRDLFVDNMILLKRIPALADFVAAQSGYQVDTIVSRNLEAAYPLITLMAVSKKPILYLIALHFRVHQSFKLLISHKVRSNHDFRILKLQSQLLLATGVSATLSFHTFPGFPPRDQDQFIRLQLIRQGYSCEFKRCPHVLDQVEYDPNSPPGTFKALRQSTRARDPRSGSSYFDLINNSPRILLYDCPHTLNRLPPDGLLVAISLTIASLIHRMCRYVMNKA